MVEIKDTSLYDELNGKIEALTDLILKDEYYGMLESTYTSYVHAKKSYEEFMEDGNIKAARSSLEMIKENYLIAFKYGIDKNDIRPLLAYYNAKFKEVNPEGIIKEKELDLSTKHNSNMLLELDELIADIDKKIAELDAQEEKERKAKKRKAKKEISS